jgi:lysine-specific demethylase 3
LWYVLSFLKASASSHSPSLDTCMTSLFSTSFMCRMCGREVCNECFRTVKELTKPDEPEISVDELTARRKLREKHAHSNPFFLSCLKRNEHTYSEFTPVTRFAQSELNRAIEEMETLLKTTETRLEIPPQGEGRTYSAVMQDLAIPFPDPITSPVYDDFTPADTPSHVASIPIYRAQTIPASYYDALPSSSPPNIPNSAFSSLWERSNPLLVKDVLPRFKLAWNPEYFIEKYGDRSCIIVECQTDQNRRVHIREFFDWFGKYENRTDCWKLKV